MRDESQSGPAVLPETSRPATSDLGSTLKFFRQWLRDPRSMAAVAPSGRDLGARIAQAVGREARRVLELGGGTGVVTQAQLERGIAPASLLVLERNPDLHEHLRERFPAVEVALADAFDLVEQVRGSRSLEVGEVDAVASGLGLLNLSRQDQRRLLEASFEVLRPGGRFVQFTYAPRSPVGRELLDELGLTARRASHSLRNLPPAFVYVLKRRPAGAPLAEA